jgi:acyl-CoA thioester hydrolase
MSRASRGALDACGRGPTIGPAGPALEPATMENAPTSCDIEIRVRYAEADQMGVVHHSRYWVYFEMGRTELLRRRGLAYRDMEQAGVFFVVAKCSARFLAPARYDDVLTLSTSVTRTGRARIDHAYQLKRASDGIILATAETTLACVDRQGQLIAIPEGLGLL